jgi:pimeloyl-ACP methyl ester carboxylesterase
MGLAAASQAMVLSTHDYPSSQNDTAYREYIGVTGVLLGRKAFYRMVVPLDNWNGTLLIYARGTGTDILFDSDEQPILDDSGAPKVGVTPLTNIPGAPLGENDATLALESELLSEGYALAASDYKYSDRFVNQGLLSWVVQDGVFDTAELTLETHALLRRSVGRIKRTLLWGRSQGSLVATKLMETAPWLFDGIMTGGTVGAGATRNWDQGLTFALAYEVTFGWDKAWGSLGGGDIPTTLSFNLDVLPELAPIALDPDNKGKLEFIRLVTGSPEIGYLPQGPDDPSLNWFYVQMLFMTEVRSDLESPGKAGGAICRNVGRTYSLTDEQKAFLWDDYRVDADDLLAKMNNHRKYKGNRSARAYLKRNYDIKGYDYRPFISMHTEVDGLVLPANESALADTVKFPHNLVQVFTHGIGHCNFTVDQWLTVVHNMVDWLDTGMRPAQDAFPESDGFDPDFVSPDWPN